MFAFTNYLYEFSIACEQSQSKTLGLDKGNNR